MSMFTQLDSVVKRFEELTEKMADPTLYDRQTEFKEVSEEIRSTHLKCNFANILFSFFLVASSSLTQNLQSKS